MRTLISTTNSSSFSISSKLRLSVFSALVVFLGLGNVWGQVTRTWSGATNTTWLTATNWSTAVPGSKTTTSNNDVAYFNNNIYLSVGINMNTQAGTHYLGALYFGTSATSARTVSNSSTSVNGTMFFNGATLNSISNTVLWNASSITHTFQNGSSTMNFGLIATNNVIQITGSGGVNIASSISGASKNLEKTGAGLGVLTLSGVNTYSGNTTISSGILALSGSGAIASSPQILVESAATFDVSTLTTALTLAASQSIRSSATGTSTTATLKVAASKGITMNGTTPGVIAFTNYGGGSTAPFTVTGTSAGALALNNAPVTVTTSTELSPGTYKLIAKDGSATGVTGTPGALTVNGSGIGNSSGSLSVVSGELILTVTSSSSSSSNIIANTGFSYPTNIDYAAYQETTLLTEANSIQVAQFTIQDGGGSADADALTTELTALTLSVANSGGLSRIALFDGSTNLKEVAGGSSAAFTGFTLSAADDGSKTFSVRVSFLSSVTDNQQFSFTVNSATANSSNSTFAAANAGAAVTSTTGDINRIEVATTDIIFDQNVSNVAENAVMIPSPTISALDNNANFDLDNTSNVVMTISSGSTTFGGTATTTVAMVAGTATFSNLIFSTPANTNTLTATQGAFTDLSSTFNVTASAPEINVKQNVTSLVSGSGSHTASSIVSGNSGSAITFTIENLGSANLTYSSITSSNTTDFTLNTTSTSSPIIPSGTTTFTVTFNPTTAGSKSTIITIINNDTNEGTYTFTVTGTGTVSSASDIITNAGFSYSSNIAYASFQTASTLTTGNSVAVNGLSLRDGGLTADADNLATTLTAISFTTGGSTAIRTAALFDGTTNIAEVAVNGATTFSFSGLTLTAADASTKNFELRVTYQATVTDNQQITFTVSSATASASTSGFAAANAGAAVSSATSDINRLEVTADRLAWVQQPSAVNTGANMSPSPTIAANDANSNRDLDYTSTITLTPSASTISTGGSIAAISGLATFSGLQFSSVGTGITLSGADGLLISTGNSSSFNVSVQEPGLLLLEDNFIHSAILTSNGYVASSGTGTNNLTAGATGLTYPNYGSSNIGNALVVANTGQDVHRLFTQQNSPTTVYASFLVNVSAALTGDYIFAFAPLSSLTTYRARTFIKASSNSGFINFGISNLGAVNYNSTPTDYALNTTHLVVVKYSFTGGTTATATVFINPNTSTEPSSGEVSFTDNTAANVPPDINSFAIRQGSNTIAPTLVMDGIRIATNWGALLGNPQYNSSNNIAAGNYNNINVISGTLTAIGNVIVNGTTTNDGVIAIGANTLTINGSISGSGQIDASSGTVAFGNTSNLSLPTAFFTGAIANLSKTAGAGTLTLNDALTTVGNLSTTASTGAVILAAGKQLTITGALVNNGAMIIETGATFKQGTSVTGNGTYNVQQYLTGSNTGGVLDGRFWYMGVPLNVTRTSSFGDETTLNRAWTWSETGQQYGIVQNATTLTPTTGIVYRRGSNGTVNFNGSGASGTGLYAQDATLTGLTKTGANFSGYHLLANPYTAYLDFEMMSGVSNNMSSTIWTRAAIGSSASMVFDTYNATSLQGVNPSGGTSNQYIAPMQAFWVRVAGNTGTTGNISMTRAMTSHDGTGGLKSGVEYPAFARVNVVDGPRYDQTLVYLRDDQNNAVDAFDSEKMFASGLAQVYTMAVGKKLVMNGLKNNKKRISVPLYFDLPSSKVYELTLAEFNMENGIILLEDKQEGIIQDFTINDHYAFYASSGTLNNRFVLHFYMPEVFDPYQAPSNNWANPEPVEGGIFIGSDGRGKVLVELELPSETQPDHVQILNAAGQVVFEADLNGAQTEFDLEAATGIYLVKVTNGTTTEIKKIIIQH